jgi:hypothetical protein
MNEWSETSSLTWPEEDVTIPPRKKRKRTLVKADVEGAMLDTHAPPQFLYSLQPGESRKQAHLRARKEHEKKKINQMTQWARNCGE